MVLLMKVMVLTGDLSGVGSDNDGDENGGGNCYDEGDKVVMLKVIAALIMMVTMMITLMVLMIMVIILANEPAERRREAGEAAAL